MSDNAPASPMPSNEELLNFHPVADAPSPVQLTGDIRPIQPTLTALPPAMQDKVRARLVDVPAPLRQSREAQFIMEELVANSVNVRVMGGLGEDATPAQREVFEIANEHRQLLRDHETIAADLRHDTRENPETGEVEPVPVHRIQGERRRAYENRMAELERQMRVLNEIDKPKRLADACDRTRAQMQQQRDMLAERREAEAVAEKALRDQRVQRMADGIVRMRTDHIG